MHSYRFFVLVAVGIAALTAKAASYSPTSPSAEPMHQRLAGMSEDINWLRQQVNQMRMDLEASQAENRELRKQIEECRSSIRNFSTQVGTANNGRDIQAIRLKREILEEVMKQLDKLGKQNQQLVQSLAKNMTQQGAPASNKFSEDYPKNGVAYIVKKGDTLSIIAQRHHSTVRDIQNANHIANPTDLRCGQTIFIPQK